MSRPDQQPDLHVRPDDFACRCDESGIQRCEAVMDWALRWLSTDRNGEVQLGKVTRANLLTAVVYTLGWGYRAEITGIANDQWSMLMTETHDAVRDEEGGYSPLTPPLFATAIQCDDVEDGLAFTLRAYYEQFGEKRERAT